MTTLLKVVLTFQTKDHDVCGLLQIQHGKPSECHVLYSSKIKCVAKVSKETFQQVKLQCGGELAAIKLKFRLSAL